MGLLFLPAVAFLTAYVLLMGAPNAAVGPHLYVVATLGAGLAGLRLLISDPAFPTVLQRGLSAVLICCGFLGLTCLYAATFVGLKYWGRVTTVDLATTYVVQAPALLSALGYPPALVFFMLAAIPLGGTVVTARYLSRLDWALIVRRHLSRAGAAIVGVGLVLVSVAGAATLEGREFGRFGEPLSLSLYPQQIDQANQSHGIDIFREAQLQRNEDSRREAYVPSASSARSNVILIVVDALRADHLSLFGYERRTSPNLEALRSEGRMHLATSAVAACNESACGLRALVSSRYLHLQIGNPITLHEVLKDHGYQIHLILSGDHKNFYGIDRIYGPVDSYSDGSTQMTRYVNDDRIVIDRLDSLAPWQGAPTLFQFHLMSTHALGERLAQTPAYGPSRNYTGNRWGSTDAEMPRLATNHYDRGVLQTDSVIAMLLGKLGDLGYLNDAVVVITGDHGESLGERGLYSHTHSVWEESLRVPFIVLAYGKADAGSMKSSRLISQVDIAPTVLRILRMPQPSTWQGIPVQVDGNRRYVHFQQTHTIGLIDTASTGALFKHWVDTRSGRQYTFNLTADPGERQDVTDKVPPDLRRQWHDELLGRGGALSTEQKDSMRGLTVGH